MHLSSRVHNLSLLFVFLPTFEVCAESVEGFEKIQELKGIAEYRMDSNGLTVLLMEDHSAPVATFMVTYRVGSRNEVTGTTGASHLLEHLMFKGTEKFDKGKGTDVSSMLQNVGARMNANTWLDRTNYYANIPIDHLELAIEIEADRMRNLFLREEDRQPEMTVVRNEFERGENSPLTALTKEIVAAAFVAHPYHHPTIGWRSDIENVTIERLREFYDTYYWPNNATLTAIGDFKKIDVLNLVGKYYGPIPASPKPIPVVYTEEPPQRGARTVMVKRAGQLGVVGIAHKVPEGAHNDTFALNVLEAILIQGKNSRLYKSLIERGLAVDIFVWNFALKDPGLFITFAYLAPGVDHTIVNDVILDEFEKLKTEGVTDEELARAITQLNAEIAYSRDGSFSVARILNDAIAMGDWTYYVRFPEEIAKVTPDAVKRVVRKYFNEESRTSGTFVPLAPTGAPGQPPPLRQQYTNPRAGSKSSPPTATAGKTSALASDSPVLSLSRSESSGTLERSTISDRIVEKKIHGIAAIAMKTEVRDVVTILATIAAGDAFSPKGNVAIADLTGHMLDKGTEETGKFELAEKLESVGASLSFSVTTHTLNISGRCLKRDLPQVISILAEQLRSPAFDEEELRKLRLQRSGEFKRLLEDPDYRAGNSLRRLIYSEDHPNYQPPVETLISDIESVTVQELKKFHKKHYGPKSMILVAVGDLDDEGYFDAVKEGFSGWAKGVKVPKYEEAPLLNSGRKLIVQMPDKTSVSVRVGMTCSVKKNDPVYLPLMMGTVILGGNFSARLMQIVRDDEGLTYGIGSGIADNSFTDGSWQINATFAPELLEKGLASTKRELNRWYEEGITEQELADKKTTLIGSYKVRLATTRGMASQILRFKLLDFPNSYIDEYPVKLEEITLEAVNQSIQKTLDPKKMVTVIAGTLEN